MTRKSLYDILQLQRNASVDEIKSGFKRRALQVHPDKGGNKDSLEK
jgi:curved DNA-binding protein CbpA